MCTFSKQQQQPPLPKSGATNLVIADSASGADELRRQQPKSPRSSGWGGYGTVHFVRKEVVDECSSASRFERRLGADTLVESAHESSSRTTTLVCYQSEAAQSRLPLAKGGGPDCNPYNNNELQAATAPTSCLYSTTSVSNVDYVAAGAPSTNVTNAVQLLERMKHQRSNRGATPDEEAAKGGLVHNLKKNFEAKCRVDRDRQRKRCSFQEDSQNNNSAASAADNELRSSLPPSPVSEHPAQRLSSPSREDLSVRRLVGAFEKTRYTAKAAKCERKQPPIPPRKSSLDFTLVPTKLGAKHHTSAQFPRRGVAPLVKSWLNKPNELRTQQSKPFSLAKLRVCQPRSGASSVYNTV